MKILKYRLPLEFIFDIQLPKGAKILKIDNQFNYPTMWILGDPDGELEFRKFRMYYTGHEVTAGEYLGTVIMSNIDLVLHYFGYKGIKNG